MDLYLVSIQRRRATYVGNGRKGRENASTNPGRSEPCFCGSGLKFKRSYPPNKMSKIIRLDTQE
jgi:hypothetical protein